MCPKSKYGNKKVEYKGIKFDSKLEMSRYLYLLSLESQGLIFNLRRQVSYELTPKYVYDEPRFTKTGKPLKKPRRRKTLETASHYIADFVYEVPDSYFVESNRRTVVEDAKGQITQVFVMKRKMMLDKHGIVVHLIKNPSAAIPSDVIYEKYEESTDIKIEPR